MWVIRRNIGPKADPNWLYVHSWDNGRTGCVDVYYISNALAFDTEFEAQVAIDMMLRPEDGWQTYKLWVIVRDEPTYHEWGTNPAYFIGFSLKDDKTALQSYWKSSAKRFFSLMEAQRTISFLLDPDGGWRVERCGS